MPKIHDFSGGMILSYAIECKFLSEALQTFYHHQFYKDENISQLGDYDGPFCKQQYSHGSCHISLFKLKSFDEFNTPKLNCLKF